MNFQICLMLATSCLALVSATSGSYNYGYNLNDPITGDLQEQRETKVCNDQVVYDEVKPILASKSYISEPIISSVTPAPILNSEYVSASPAPILRSDFDSSRIVAAAQLLETKIEAEPVIYASRPEYAPLPKFAAPITVTAAPMLETKIASEPLIYAPVPRYAAISKYSPRPEYLAASPAPLVASRLPAPVVQVQAAPAKIIKSAQLVSYGRQGTTYSQKSFVNHPQTPVKVAAIAAPQYYAAAPAAPSYYAAAPAAPTYYAAAPAASSYYAAAPAAPSYYAAAPAAPEYYAPAPVAPVAVKIANPVLRATVPLQQAAAGLVYAPSAQYAYRSSSSPATSYQYSKHWNSDEQLAAGQLRYVAASPQYYSAAYQPQSDSATVTQVHNLGQYDAAQEQPCEK